MNAISMLQTSVLLFAIAAAGGLVMAGIRLFRKHNPPAWLSMVHGLLASAGLTLVAYAVLLLDAPSPAGWAALLFVVAAAGGAAMNLLWQWKGRPLPVGLLVVHALLAVVALYLLVVAAF